MTEKGSKATLPTSKHTAAVLRTSAQIRQSRTSHIPKTSEILGKRTATFHLDD